MRWGVGKNASHFQSSLPLGFGGFILFFSSSIRTMSSHPPTSPPCNNPTLGGESTPEPRLPLLTFLAQFLPLFSVWFSEVSPLSGDQILAPAWPSGDPFSSGKPYLLSYSFKVLWEQGMVGGSVPPQTENTYTRPGLSPLGLLVRPLCPASFQ